MFRVFKFILSNATVTGYPLQNVLREEIKEKFKYEVDRTSPSNKLRDFMDWSSCIIDDIKYQRKIHANPVARFFVQSWWWLNPAVLLVTAALCIIVLVSWKAPDNDTDPVPDMSSYQGAKEMIWILGGVHNLLSLFIFISYILSNHPTFPRFKDLTIFFTQWLPSREDDDDDEEVEDSPAAHLEVKFFSVTTFYYITFEQELNGVSYPKTLLIAIFDLIFFILITTIGLNIIFGIIVDTFSELRDSKWQIDNDMKTTCFICSRESYDFERQAGGFEKHVKQEHNQWAYLFFFIHLDETRPNDYSALELYVHKLLKKNNFDFFPLNRALSLISEEDSSEVKLETLMNQVEYLVTKMKEEEAAKEREKEKQRQLEWEAKHKQKSSRSSD
ncbi:inositol 1,4,5-trisphosphate receptor type 1 [Elysia marginata]|uniref:Inositol 1,4,5-trisphosphate receptor type 1 n=1 Tax=Elysia marginata TaxID=1093978 RepID=A0AAV4FIW4_9GAST|nr:inositol 1,4,5-trisphosphate receptor type 1 [Elysia marginata]